MVPCECRDGCACSIREPGPAAFLIMRKDAPLRVCTRCVLTDGDKVICSIVPVDPPSRELFEYDPIGWFMLAGRDFPTEDEVGGEA